MREGYPCSLPPSRFQAGAVGQLWELWSLTLPISVTNGRSISGTSKVYPQTELWNNTSLHCSEGQLQVPSNFWNFPNDYSQHWRNQLCICCPLLVSFISPHIPLLDIFQNKKKKKKFILKITRVRDEKGWQSFQNGNILHMTKESMEVLQISV